MEPVTAAIIGALARLSEKAVADGYEALKELLKRKFGAESDIVIAAEKVRETPDSEAWKAVLDEQARKLQVAHDDDLRRVVDDLNARIGATDSSVHVTVSDNATAQGIIGAGRAEVGEMTFGTPKKD